MAKPPKRREWTKQTLRVKENHGWKCKPGYRIFVADRGAVRFDFPTNWLVRPADDGSIKFHDREPPDDDCVLSMSVLYLRDDIDWKSLKILALLEGITGRESLKNHTWSEIVEVKHPRHELAWRESESMDLEANRAVKSRTALARWSNIQVVLTFEFWADCSPHFGKVWDELIRTLTIGDYIEDPTQRLEVESIDDLFA